MTTPTAIISSHAHTTEWIFFAFTGVALLFFSIYITVYGYKVCRGLETAPDWDCGVIRFGEIKTILNGVVIFSVIFALVKFRWCVSMFQTQYVYEDILLWEIIDGGFLLICRFIIAYAGRHLKCLTKNNTLRICKAK